MYQYKQKTEKNTKHFHLQLYCLLVEKFVHNLYIKNLKKKENKKIHIIIN